MFAATGDPAFKERVDPLVDGLGGCQRSLGSGYLSAFPVAEFEKLETRFFDGVWAPYYTIHKIMSGLLNAHEHAGNPRAREIAVAMADYFAVRIARLTPESLEKMTLTNHKGNPAIKLAVDKDRQPGRFLLTGSANVMTLPHLSDSLAGRMEIIPLHPFSAGELRKQISWTDPRATLHHFRTATGWEVDLVLEKPDGSLAAIEVKASGTVGASDFGALGALRDRLGQRFRAGVTLYTGDQVVPFGDKLWLVPISALWAE